MQFYLLWNFDCPGYADRALPWPQHVTVSDRCQPGTRVISNVCPLSFDSLFSFVNFPLSHAITGYTEMLFYLNSSSFYKLCDQFHRPLLFFDPFYKWGTYISSLSQHCHSWMNNENNASELLFIAINFHSADFWGNLNYYIYLCFFSSPGMYCWSL
jgi:hypothetical protein